MMPITLWLELSALGREVWSRGLEESEGWARQAGKGQKPSWEAEQRPRPTRCPPRRKPARNSLAVAQFCQRVNIK